MDADTSHLSFTYPSSSVSSFPPIFFAFCTSFSTWGCLWFPISCPQFVLDFSEDHIVWVCISPLLLSAILIIYKIFLQILSHLFSKILVKVSAGSLHALLGSLPTFAWMSLGSLYISIDSSVCPPLPTSTVFFQSPHCIYLTEKWSQLQALCPPHKPPDCRPPSFLWLHFGFLVPGAHGGAWNYPGKKELQVVP